MKHFFAALSFGLEEKYTISASYLISVRLLFKLVTVHICILKIINYLIFFLVNINNFFIILNLSFIIFLYIKHTLLAENYGNLFKLFTDSCVSVKKMPDKLNTFDFKQKLLRII